MAMLGIQYHRRTVARSELERVGGSISTGRELSARIDRWLPEVLQCLFYEHWEVHLSCANITDAGMANLNGLTCVEVLWLDYAQGVTDAGLANVKGLVTMRHLKLDGTGVTDAGLEHLKSMTRLETLSLWSASVTDAGLKCLTGLTRLKTLYLYGTKVTEPGVAKLKRALPNAEIHTDWKIYE